MHMIGAEKCFVHLLGAEQTKVHLIGADKCFIHLFFAEHRIMHLIGAADNFMQYRYCCFFRVGADDQWLWYYIKETRKSCDTVLLRQVAHVGICIGGNACHQPDS